jgi:hypothetical protein
MAESELEIGLTEFITALRNDLQLSVAGAAAASASLRFVVENLELDVELSATKTVTAEGGAKVTFFVVDANAAAKRDAKTTQTHRVKLKLAPVWNGDDRYKVLVAAESVTKPT